ncbi:MAG: DNA topoisomerase VI subunit B [Archaeoglobaceae archaeon]|nr:DNA topoisomerase VI subunit B [Archaeoglobaceae archaeon]
MIAEELAKKQKEISIAEFFEKNKHILGYSNPARSLITCVKEAVDNALDACEDAGILPDILVKIRRVEKNVYRITIEDNGPGIIKEQIPKVFGKLLYGSRFHVIRQSRGQQGIGISSAVLYAQLTTGKPAEITSKIANSKAYKLSIFINTKNNEPEVISEEEVEWYMPSGTKIELEIVGSYTKEKKQSVYEYLKETSVANPHAKITFVDPDGEIVVFERISEQIPEIPKEIKPHPHGIELGTLMNMLKNTKAKDIKSFLKSEFVRVGEKTAEEVLKKAGLKNTIPKKLSRDEIVKLLNAFRETNFLPPPTDCLSPIGEDAIMKSLMAEYNPEFVFALTRKPKVYSGHPFLIEVGLAYGGEIKGDDKVSILRFANKVPLLYQQSGCALTRACENVNWRNYGLNQSKNELPYGPAVILIHLASTNVPYTSESKEAIAPIPEIIDEVKLSLQEVGRRLKEYIGKKQKLQKKKKKEEVLNKILPLLAKKVCEVLEKEPLEIEKVVARIMGYVFVEREVVERNGMLEVTLSIVNHSKAKKEFKIYEICSGKVEVENAKILESNYLTILWDVKIKDGEEIRLKYTLKGKVINKKPLVEGIDNVLGAEMMT